MFEGIYFKSRNFVAMTRKDGEDFSAALLQEFPTIRFLRSDYSTPWVDKAASVEQIRKRDAGLLPRSTPSNVMRNPAKDSPPFIASLGEATFVQGAKAWVLPPGWHAEWSQSPNSEGIYTIVNKPRLEFEFTRSCYIIRSRNRAFDEPPGNLGENEILVLACDRLYGRFRRDDKEQQAFLRKVFRVLSKVTTTEVAWCDRATREPKGICETKSVWVGFDALAWMRQDPRHYVRDSGTYYRPPECVRRSKN
jgi:hypothetical protein